LESAWNIKDASSSIVMATPAALIYTVPNIKNGATEHMSAIIVQMNAAFWSRGVLNLLMIAATDSAAVKTVRIAVKNGEKLAYPKGVRLK
jgi:hypothetical protein